MSRPLPRPLYLMIKPPRAIAEAIAADPRAERPVDQLHITLMLLGDARDYSEFRMHQLVEALDHVPLQRFRVTFDCVHEAARTVALRGSERNGGIIAFQAALRRGLFAQGIRLPAYNFNPHITLAYARDGQGMERIDPISWLVDEFALVESVHGEGRHIEHGHFALLPPPFALPASAGWQRPRAPRGLPGGFRAAASSKHPAQLALF